MPQNRHSKKYLVGPVLLFVLAFMLPARAAEVSDDELAQIKQMLLDQRREIDELRHAYADQKKQLADLGEQLARRAPSIAEGAETNVPPKSLTAQSDLAGQTAPSGNSSMLEATNRLEDAVRNIGGFRFSGDFIYVFDAQARAGNRIAPALENLRSRYRVRLNVDKSLNDRLEFHLQLSTGLPNNQLTVLQDFAGVGPKSQFSIAEAWIAFNPNKTFSFRVGRMDESYMDGSRFLIDENLRLNGFEQAIRAPINGTRGIFNGVFTSLEFRAGEYILTNPNIVSVPANSPYIAAGYPVGSHVGAADMFHPGVTLRGILNDNWKHRLTATMQIYRNANQIQLASTAAGIAIPSDGLGVVASSPLTGAGNATTTPSGAMYSAPDFRIAHLSYRADTSSLVRAGHKSVPGFFELQALRNVGAHKLRDAAMASFGLGEVHKRGDVRGLYQFTIKDANSMISQLTDDDLGTGTGVNLAVHGIRIDVGLTRFLQWQNMFYIQHQKSASNPAEAFYVPVQRGASATFRYFGQLLFVF